MTIEFSEEEAKILEGLLALFISETRSEIHHTDTSRFRDALKAQESAAKQLLEKFKA